MTITGTVLVASDLTRGSDEAIRQAAMIAGQAGSALVACHIVPEIFGIRPLFPQLRELDREEADRVRRLVTAALEEQLQRVLEHGAPGPEVRIEAGSPHSTVLEIAKDVGAGLIVVGGRGEGGVAERVARHASCPVLIASSNEGRAVLAATDFSDPALPAVHLAGQEADRRGLPLVIVHAIDLHASQLNLPEIVSPSLIERVAGVYRDGARERIEELASRVGPKARIVLREGPAIDEILAAADEAEAQLIVMGTHGRSGLGRLALGSVAEGVVRRAKCSVLVVRLGS